MSPSRLPSSLLVAVGLAAGFAIAQGTGVRAFGGAVFVGAGLAAGWLWYRRRGAATTVALAAGYVGAFVAAHLIAIGLGFDAWLAVSLVTIPTAGVTYLVADRPTAGVPAR